MPTALHRSASCSHSAVRRLGDEDVKRYIAGVDWDDIELGSNRIVVWVDVERVVLLLTET